LSFFAICRDCDRDTSGIRHHKRLVPRPVPFQQLLDMRRRSPTPDRAMMELHCWSWRQRRGRVKRVNGNKVRDARNYLKLLAVRHRVERVRDSAYLPFV